MRFYIVYRFLRVVWFLFGCVFWWWFWGFREVGRGVSGRVVFVVVDGFVIVRFLDIGFRYVVVYVVV